VPRHVRGPAELLAGHARHYVFISTCSVYPDLGALPIDEASRVGELEDPSIERIDGGTYGPLKVLCERAAEAAFPGRTTVIRPGLIVGDGDTSDRFGYWPRRIAEGGEVLCPGEAEWTTQFTDVRDLGAFVVRTIERESARHVQRGRAREPVEWLDLLTACNLAGGGAARLTWVEPEWLTEQGVRPARDLPLWGPASRRRRRHAARLEQEGTCSRHALPPHRRDRGVGDGLGALAPPARGRAALRPHPRARGRAPGRVARELGREDLTAIAVDCSNQKK
jgi:nucleoside-diphosphate-sugar epimerase